MSPKGFSRVGFDCCRGCGDVRQNYELNEFRGFCVTCCEADDDQRADAEDSEDWEN